MSSIDERVVKMEFDNKQFEKGVSTTEKSLDSLKKSLNFDGANKSLSSLEATAKKGISLESISSGLESISNRFSALGIIGMTVLQELTKSAINVGKRIGAALLDPIIQGGKQRALNIEQAKFQFEGLGLDVEKAMNSAREAVLGTAYGLDAAAKVASQLAASGMQAGDEMTSSLRAVAGVAAMTSSSYEDIGSVFTKIAGQGRVMGDDLLRLSSRGMNAAATIAQFLGKTEAEVRDMVTKGKIDFKTFSDAMDQAFGEHATSANKTFTGAMSNMKAALSRIGATFWTPVLESSRDFFNSITPFIDGFHKALTPAINMASKFIDQISKFAQIKLDGFDTTNLSRIAYPAILAVTNALEVLGSILKPIGQAFKEIFPAPTIDQIVVFTYKLKDLIGQFKLSDTASENLRRTFKGLFSLIDIGKMLLEALGTGIFQLVKFFAPATEGVLGFTGGLGDGITKVRDFIKENDLFTKGIQLIGDIIGPIAEGIKAGFGIITDAIKSFLGIDTGGFDDFAEKVKTRLEPLQKILEGIGKTFAWFIELIKNIINALKPLGDLIKSAFDGIKNAIGTALGEGDFSGVSTLINEGLLIGIVLKIKDFINSLTSITDNAGGFLETLKGLFTGVGNLLNDFSKQVKAKTLLTIAGAIAVLAGSLFVLSTIDQDQLMGALMAITVLFTELFAFMGAFSKILSAGGYDSVIKVASAMIIISTAVLILSAALKNISGLDWEDLIKGLLGLAGMMVMLSEIAKVLKDVGSFNKTATALLILSTAVLILSQSVKQMAALGWEEMAQGLIGVGILLYEISVFSKNVNDLSFPTAAGILVLSTAILILAKAVEVFAAMNPEAMAQGLIGVGVVLLMISEFVNETGDANKVISTAVGMTILGAAMLIFAEAVEKFGSMSIEQLAKGLLSMGAALAIVIAALWLMPTNIVGMAIGMTILATSLLLIGQAVKNLGSMTWEELAKGLIGMAVALGLVIAALWLIPSNFIAIAAGLVVVGAALLLFAGVISILGAMPAEMLIQGLVGIAAAFAILFAAAVFLGPFTGVLAALAGVVALVGIALLAAGAGVLAFGVGLTMVAAAGLAAVNVIITAVQELVNLIPFILTKFGEGIIALATVIGEGAPALLEAIVALLTVLITAIIEVTPQAVNAILFLVMALLDALVAKIPDIVTAGMQLLAGLLQGIADNIGDVIDSAGNIIISFLDGIGQKIPEIIDAGFKMVVSLITGITDSITENTPLMAQAVGLLLAALIKSVVEGFGETLATVFKELMGDGITSILDLFTESIPGFNEAGSDLITNGFLAGVQESMISVQTAFENMLTEVSTYISSQSSIFNEAGAKLISEGLLPGIESQLTIVSSDILTPISTMLNQISTEALSLNTSISSVNDIMSAMSVTISSSSTSITAAFTSMITSSLAVLNMSAPQFTAAGSQIMVSFSTGVQSQSVNLSSTFTNILVTSNALILSRVSLFAQSGRQIMSSGLIMGIRSQSSSLISTITTLLNSLSNYIISQIGIFNRAGSQIIREGIISGIQSQQGSLMALITQMMSQAVQEISLTRSGWYSAGQDLANGLRDGINNKASEVSAAAAALASNALLSAKRAIASNSPSKKFMELGEDADRGFAIGLTEFAYLAENAAEEVGTDTLSSLKSTMSKLSEVIDDNIDMNPVIRPVLDLTDVQNGVQDLSRGFNQGLDFSVTSAQSSKVNIPSPSNPLGDLNNQNGNVSNVTNFTQINNSPKQPSRLSQYQDTKNLLSLAKGVIS